MAWFCRPTGACAPWLTAAFVAGLLYVPFAARALAEDGVLADHSAVGQSQGAGAGSLLVVGDRLRISFYSQIGAAGGRRSNLSSMIERQDLTGEYVVQADGTIFLPFIGKIDAAGRTEPDLLALLEKSSSEALAGEAKVSLRSIEREPVYVSGDVPQPGAFRYSSGMMVMHVAALAGLRGIGSQPGTDPGSRLAVLQESERVQQSQLRMADLIAQRDALIATRDGSPAAPSEELKDLVGAQEASDLVVAAQRVTTIEQKRLTDEQKALGDGRTMLERERSMLILGLGEAEKSMKFHVARFDKVTEMHDRGVMTDASFDIARSELDSSRSRWNDILAALARVEARMIEIQQQATRSAADSAITRERRINELQADIRQAMVVRAVMEPALGLQAVGEGRHTAPVFRIVRRSRGGVQRIEVDDAAFVVPGDVVEVVRQTGRPGKMSAKVNDGY